MTNPLLARVKLPGRIFQLPSKGVFYGPDVLSETVKNAEIEVRPMSALAEMKFRSPDMLFTGRALREICLECAPEILRPEKLVSKDVDAIFCFLRIATYGAILTVKSVHDCPKRQAHDYAVDIEQIIMNANNKILENPSALYNFVLSNGQKIILRPVIYQDAINMIHLKQEIQSEMDKDDFDSKLLEKAVTQDLMAVIASVDDVTDPKMIEEWVKMLPRKFFTEIVRFTRSTEDWGFNLTVKLKCKDCEAEYPHNLELNPINFFSG